MVLDVSMLLAVITMSHKLDGILVDVKPEVPLSNNLVCQGWSFEVTSIDAFMDFI